MLFVSWESSAISDCCLIEIEALIEVALGAGGAWRSTCSISLAWEDTRKEVMSALSLSYW